MPPVDHAPGAVPEAYQPPSNPRKTRKVLWFLAGTMLLVAAWRGCPEIYHRVHPNPQAQRICCGCSQAGSASTCPSRADCAKADRAVPGCPSPRPGA